jgi:hypothetical protein
MILKERCEHTIAFTNRILLSNDTKANRVFFLILWFFWIPLVPLQRALLLSAPLLRNDFGRRSIGPNILS